MAPESMKKHREAHEPSLRMPPTSSAPRLTRSCRQGETALHIAAVENHLEMAQLLLQRGASVSEDAM
jgi:hypothetical protein